MSGTARSRPSRGLALRGRGLARAATRIAVPLILWWLVALESFVLIAHLPPRVFHHDFSVFYCSAVALRNHLDPYTIDLVPIGRSFGMGIWPLIHTTDTPTALMLFQPLASIAPIAAYNVWLAFNVTVLVIAVILLVRPRRSGMGLSAAYAVAALALVYAPVTDNLLFSQRQGLILLLLVMAMGALEREREARAGLLLATAVAYRIFPIVMVGYFVTRRQWRPLWFMALGLALIGAVTVAVMGLPLCLDFTRGVHLAMTATSDPSDVAVRGFIIRSFVALFGDRPGWLVESLQRITILAAQVTILALAAGPSLRGPRPPRFDQRAWGLWAAATVIISPLAWFHYMVLLLIPFVAIAGAGLRGECSRRTLRAATASYLLAAVTIYVRQDLVSPQWWQGGVRYLAEGSSVALMLGFAAAYWFARDAVAQASTSEAPGPSARSRVSTMIMGAVRATGR